MGRRAIALGAAAILAMGVAGVGAARVGGYLSHASAQGSVATQATSAASGGATSRAGTASASQVAPPGDAGGQAGD
jgi:hypothetical protein